MADLSFDLDRERSARGRDWKGLVLLVVLFGAVFNLGVASTLAVQWLMGWL